MQRFVQGYSRDARSADFIFCEREFVISMFCVTCEERKLLVDVRDIATLFSVILRRESSEWWSRLSRMT